MTPKGWEKFKIAELLEKKIIQLQIDGNHGELYPKASEFVESGVPYLSANCIVDGRLDVSKAKFLTEEKFKKLKKGISQRDDVLFAHNATVGPTALNTIDGESVLSTTLTLYRCNKNALNPLYLKNYFSSPLFSSQYTRVMAQSTRNQVPITAQREFEVLLPPMNEQEKIANILSTWDEAIEKYEVILKKKERMYQVSLNDTFGKSTANGSWADSSLEGVSLKITDGAHSSPPSSEGGCPMLSVKDMREFGFDLSQPRLISEKHYRELINLGCKPEVGDVLIAKDGSVLKYIFEVKKPIEAVLLSSIAIIRPNPEIVIPSFLAHFFRRDNFKEYVRRELTSGSGVPRIVLRDFRKIKIHVPDLTTQKKIVAFLDTTNLDIVFNRRIIDLLKIQKQGIMQQLLTGKKRVKV